jgi:hypothetical protein
VGSSFCCVKSANENDHNADRRVIDSLQKMHGENIAPGNVIARTLANSLVENQSLKLLILSVCDVGPGEAAAIAGAIKINKTLERLDLDENSIGEEGASAFAQA